MIRLFVLTLILTSVTSAAAQGDIPPKNPVGTYDAEWASVSIYTSVEFASGTATVEVTALTPGDPLVEPSWLLFVSGVKCWAWTSGRCECELPLAGTLRWWYGVLPDNTVNPVWFDLELFTDAGHAKQHVIAAGAKRIPGRPPSTP
jgi:hypothetical protein